MLLLRESNLVFVHNPKCAGTWVREFLRLSCPGVEPMQTAVHFGTPSADVATTTACASLSGS